MSTMEDEELQELRARKMRDMMAERQAAQAEELQKKLAVRQLLEPDAYERLMNVRMANPQLYEQVVAMLLYLYQNGQIRGRVSGAQLRTVLEKMSAKRKESTITRLKK